jgi:hypothetical protein
MANSELFIKNSYDLNCDTIAINTSATIDGKNIPVFAFFDETYNITSYPLSSPAVSIPIDTIIKRIGYEQEPDMAFMYIPQFTIPGADITVNTQYLEIEITSASLYPAPNVYNSQICTVQTNTTTFAAGTIMIVLVPGTPNHYYLRIYPGYPKIAANGTVTPDTTNYANGFVSGQPCGLGANVIFTYIQQFE